MHRHGEEDEDQTGELEDDLEFLSDDDEPFGAHNKLIASTYMEPMVVLGFVLTACICIVCWMRFTDNKKAAAVEHALKQQPLEATPLMDTIHENIVNMEWSETQ